MTLNVNYKGNHIGFVARSYPENSHLFMVALTSFKVEDVDLNTEKMKAFLARAYGSTNFFGKINEERLQAIMETKRQGKYGETGIENYEDFLRFKFMKTADERGYEIEKLYNWEQLQQHVKGYLLVDIEHAHIEKNIIQFHEEINYFSEETLPDYGTPIFAKINEYPIFRTDIMGAAEGLLLGANFSDFAGRNHAHETEIKIKSGNFEKKISFPIQMNVKKEMPIQFYLTENKIKRIFCDGAIYEF